MTDWDKLFKEEHDPVFWSNNWQEWNQRVKAEGDAMQKKLGAIKLMIGSLVAYWRNTANDEERPLQKYYLDAYLSVQKNIDKILEGEE